MKKTILLFFLSFCTILCFAQIHSGNCGEPPEEPTNPFHSYAYTQNIQAPAKAKFLIYPNPVTTSFKIDAESVEEGIAARVNIYNLIGQQVKSFDIAREQQYDVADLREGLYLIQILDRKNKILTTRRLHKVNGFRL